MIYVFLFAIVWAVFWWIYLKRVSDKDWKQYMDFETRNFERRLGNDLKNFEVSMKDNYRKALEKEACKKLGIEEDMDFYSDYSENT
jgi:hypothetical protein